jgi:transposase-like protein
MSPGTSASTTRRCASGCARPNDAGKRKELLSSEEREELAQLRKDNRELRRANEILKSASAFFAAEVDPAERSELVAHTDHGVLASVGSVGDA